jgi:N-acetyl-anhydromuramyl-L-alanine amidase AmpD
MAAWGETLREPRIGIMVHYDASASDAGALAWLRSPECKVSYTWIILDDGSQITIAPPDARAWHAGVCRPSNPRLPYRDANSAFYGIAIAATAGDRATPRQAQAVANLCVALFQRHQWSRATDLYRIVGHNTECWPRGRKTDPEGPNRNDPVLSVEDIRDLVRA